MEKLFKFITVACLCLTLTSCKALASGTSPESKIDNPYMVLVNKTHKLPDNWTDLVNFEVGKNSLGEIYIVEEAALRAFEALRADLLEMTEESYDFVMDINTKGTLFLTQKVANYMLLIALAVLPASVQYPFVTGGTMIVSTVISLICRQKPSWRELVSVGLSFAGVLVLVFLA